ncbi:hypothetical protein SAMN05660841_03971 [Sphingobacterium nematocida]|uniref:Uncharacterized protein n=1 Tax=Sphingobacterium nematocida TaxID=1513896 RepID=A0A1T5GDS5_9SPHI|nr:hypothetical protein [Sphingobacterium nematocida]SKC06549.1 hypothetical protein SAMN05660841_03971 [Sphingobacterium nematocida]
MAWFNYTGSDPSNPNHYTLATTPPSCGTTEQRICAINATNNGSDKPILDASLLSEMVRALEFQANEPNVQLKAR